MIEDPVFNDYAVRLNLDFRLLRNRASAEQLKEKLRQDLISRQLEITRQVTPQEEGCAERSFGRPESLFHRLKRSAFWRMLE
jgi:hypothetical protein